MNLTRPALATRIPAAAFALAAAAVYAAVIAIVRTVPGAARPGALAYGMLADLLLTVPALWYLLVVRGRAVPARTLFPILAASFAGASLVLPPAVRPGQFGLGVVIAVVELAAISVLTIAAVRALRRTRTGARAAELAGPGELPEHLAAAARQAFGIDRVADLLAFEVSTFAYAVAGWRMKPDMGPRAFTSHLESGWSAAAVGFAVVLLVEAFPVHVLAARAHAALAWVLTASTLYSLVWLIGDYQALRLRPMRFTGDALLVRLGLRWSVRVPYALIRAAIQPGAEAEAALKRETLRAVLLGDASVVLELSEPVVAAGPYGITRRVTRVALAPDDRRAFMAALAAVLPPSATPQA